MMPASRPCSSTTAERDEVVCCRRAPPLRSAACRARRPRAARSAPTSRIDGDGDGDLRASGTAPTSFWPGAGQVNRRQRLAAAFERLQRLDRVVDDVRCPATATNSVVIRPGGGVLAELEELRDFPPFLRAPSARGSRPIAPRAARRAGRRPASGSISSTMSATRSLSSDSTIETWMSGSISSSASAATSSSIVSKTASRSAGGRSSTMSAMSAGWSLASPRRRSSA